MKNIRFACIGVLLSIILSVQANEATTASSAPPILPGLQEAVANIPIPGIGDAMHDLYKGLKQGQNGGYAAKTTVNVPGMGTVPLQLYFFGNDAKQALILVVDRELALPQVFNNKSWKRLAGASLSDPIFSLSTVDYALDVRDMPADFKKVVSDSYFNVTSLNFTSGFQVSAKIKLGGAMKKVVEQGMNLNVSEFTLRAGVVVPVPSDASSSASLAAQLAADMKDVTKTVKDLPDFFVEFQPKPGSTFVAPLGMSDLTLTDATISLTAHSVLGFRGNMLMSGKKYITFFQTPLTPEGAMDFADFQFGMTAQTITLQEYALWNTAMVTPKAPGGSFIKGIDKYKDQLMALSKPLAVFQIRNPYTIGEYKFGDATKPFPPRQAFLMLVMGPLASSTDSNGQTLSGPYLQGLGDFIVLKQKMASTRVTAGDSGLHGLIESDLKLKLGPLGKTAIRMRASADVTAKQQLLLMQGNVLGRSLMVSMDPNNLSIDSPATCATPFELKQTVKIDALLDLDGLMDSLPGVNVDPAKLQNCIGKDLEAAYKWVATTGSSLAGYTAAAANAELNKIANQAAEAAKKAEQEAKAAYNKTKDLTRDKANQVSNTAMNSFRDAGNAFKKLGRKKKHKKGPDPKFASSVFDWDYYYDIRPDVVAAGVDLASHWGEAGFWEGRQGAPEFHTQFYLNRYPDVKQQCGADLQCALNHWLDYGIAQGRQGSTDFSISDFIDRYPDVQQRFGRENYEDAMDFWLNDVEPGTRNGSPASSFAGQVAGPLVAGGGGGSPWSDRDVCAGQALTGFRIAYGGSIDGLQFQYANRNWAQPHGYNKGYKLEVVLPPGEFFIQASFAAGSMVDQLWFYTNRGRAFGPYGGGRITNGYAPLGGQAVGCMAGRSGTAIDQLTFSATGPR